MKIKTIEVSMSVESSSEMGLKRWNGTRMIAEIEETEDEIQRTAELRTKVGLTLGINNGMTAEQYRNNIASHIDWNRHEEPIPQSIPVNDISKEKTEIAIDNAASLDELAKLKIQAEKYYLQSAYINKMKQFI